MADELNYEQLSYGKFGYRRVQRMRRRGKRHGIEVPPLGFVLTKPDRPRIVFWIAAIVGAVLLAALLVGIGFIIKFGIEFFNVQFQDNGGFFETLLNPAVFLATAGLSFFPVLFVILAYLMMLLIMLIPILVFFYSYGFVRNTFYMARCSKEEFAKGELVSSRIFGFAGAIVLATVALIIGLISFETSAAKILVGVVYAGFVLICGGMLVLMIRERSKCKKWFDSLDEYKKQNFLEHDNALRRIKSRTRPDLNVWHRWGRF